MISVIATVLNEGESIRRLMDSLAAQTRPPDEIVIVDGGSRDNTVAILQEYAGRLPLRVLVEPGCNISAGRNRAIAAAQGDIIASTDAGVVLSAGWLEHLTAPFENPAAQVVSGFFRAEACTPFELAMGATVLPLVEEIDPATFLPSSRSVAFRKSAWAAVGGYPEWLDYCEDLIFDLRLRQELKVKSLKLKVELPVASYQLPESEKEKGESIKLKAPVNPGLETENAKLETGNSKLSTQYSVLSTSAFDFAPDALVDFRPRGSLRAFFKQYYRYARGDGKADLWRKRHAIRYLTYLVAAPGVLLAGLRLHPLLWALCIPGAVYYFGQPYRRLPKLLQRPENRNLVPTPGALLEVLLLIPVIRVVGDVAKMLGYPVGRWWRLRNRPPDWWQQD
jgi:glycosyltransferase involved in cell wall biosynthesis